MAVATGGEILYCGFGAGVFSVGCILGRLLPHLFQRFLKWHRREAETRVDRNTYTGNLKLTVHRWGVATYQIIGY